LVNVSLSPICIQALSDSAKVTVNPLPVANFTIAQPALCANNSIVFSDVSTAPVGSTITQWNWDFGDGSPISALNNPTHTYIAGTYKIKYSVSNGCTSLIDSATSITVHPLPVVNFTTAPICLPGAAQFTDLSTVADGSSINKWAWDFGDGNTSTNGPTTSNTYLVGGTYPVTLTVSSGYGCQNDTTINDTVNSTPIAKDSIINDTSLCSNRPVILIDESSVSTGSITKIDIVWGDGQDTSINDPSANGNYAHKYSPVSPEDQDAVYDVSITAYSGNGCPPNSTAPFPITVHGTPKAEFTLTPTVICQEAASFNLTGGFDTYGLAITPGSYSGPGVVGDSAFSPQRAGAGGPYLIVYTATTISGCSDTASQDITVYPTPSVDYGGVQSILQGDSITLVQKSVSGVGLQYLWSPATYLSSDTSATPLCLPDDSITYNITVTSPGGCRASTLLLVQVLKDFDVPNTFTPNGDGINDTWVIQNLPQFPIQWVQVFDRYGQLLYESHGYSTPWDGTYKGHALPMGTYYYIIELGGLISPKTGYVTILR